jgi:CubicO group peptidase (beta-lactamase class C family)
MRRERICPPMLSLKSCVHFLLAVAFWTCLTSYLVAQSKVSAGQEPGDSEARIRRIEATVVDMPIGENEPPLRLGIVKLMQLYKVPGLSIAVIDNFRIVWAKAYGVIEAGSTTAVTPRTLFQAGSISKPVAATGALYLVEQGKLSLDQDVNEKLKTWKVPENEFTKNEKVTLRRLMSHTAGLTVHGFPGYDVNDSVPTLVQIFNGEKPANTAPIRVDFVPGTRERYSGGGVTIEQQLMMDVTGKAFPDLMRETVLDRIGMTDSSYQQPLPPAKAALTASGIRADGKVVHGRWHIYPEMAAAGLWTTPTDLGKFAIEIALSKQGKSNRVLSPAMTREMLTPVLDEAGLGFFLDKNNPGYFEHNGADEGFQAILTMSAESGKGVAIMANSDNGITVGNFLLESVAKEYGWNYKLTEHGPFPALVLISKLKGTEAALERYTELKRSQSADHPIVESTLNELGYTLLSSGQAQDAITVFRRNAQEYPKSANVYDSLGEAYMRAGRKDLAIQNYEMSLKLDPANQNAVEMLRKLKEP